MLRAVRVTPSRLESGPAAEAAHRAHAARPDDEPVGDHVPAFGMEREQVVPVGEVAEGLDPGAAAFDIEAPHRAPEPARVGEDEFGEFTQRPGVGCDPGDELVVGIEHDCGERIPVVDRDDPARDPPPFEFAADPHAPILPESGESAQTRSVAAATTVRAMTTPAETVTAFCAAWETGDLDAIMAFFSDDAVYHNIPVDPLTGPEAIRAMIEMFTTGVDRIEFQVRNLAAAGSVVLTERIDVFHRAEGTITLPVMGTFEVRDGKIAAWRDYFDLNQYMSQVSG